MPCIAALESVKREREISPVEIETTHPGDLINRVFFVGYLKDFGRIYQQTIIDTYSSVAFAKVPVTAADALNDRVLSFFEKQRIPVLRVLTGRRTGYCGSPDQHPYSLHLRLNEIEL
jgi:hypothetical protein